MKLETIMQALRLINLQNEADGCKHCAFSDKGEWEMPCVKCKRNCKDYWRYEGEEK